MPPEAGSGLRGHKTLIANHIGPLGIADLNYRQCTRFYPGVGSNGSCQSCSVGAPPLLVPAFAAMPLNRVSVWGPWVSTLRPKGNRSDGNNCTGCPALLLAGTVGPRPGGCTVLMPGGAVRARPCPPLDGCGWPPVAGCGGGGGICDGICFAGGGLGSGGDGGKLPEARCFLGRPCPVGRTIAFSMLSVWNPKQSRNTATVSFFWRESD